MSKREFVAIVALLVVGFIAYEIIVGLDGVDPNEVEPQTTSEQVRAYVAALPTTVLLESYPRETGLPGELPAGGGQLALVGSPGELYFSVSGGGTASVRILSAAGDRVVWSTRTERRLEIIGAYGPEVFVRFVDERFESPDEVWSPDGIEVLDVLSPARGVRPVQLEPEVVEIMRQDLARYWRPPSPERPENRDVKNL